MKFQDHTEIMKTIMLFNLTGSSMIELVVFAVQASDLKKEVSKHKGQNSISVCHRSFGNYLYEYYTLSQKHMYIY